MNAFHDLYILLSVKEDQNNFSYLYFQSKPILLHLHN